MAELINPSSYNDFTLQTLMTPDGITRLNSLLSQLSQNIAGDTENVRVFQGVGTPEASIAAGVGSLYMRTDGGTNTSIYRKESGSADTGWVAVTAPATLPLSVANGGTGADNSTAAQGTILYFSATGVLSVLGVGTSGQVLKTNGAAANPSWGSVSIYTAGDYKVMENPTVLAQTNATSYTKIIEIYIPGSGTLRIKFWLAVSGAATGYGRIYRNGSAVGTERTLTTSVGTQYSEDISGWTAGDLLQIYSKTSTGAEYANCGAVELFEGTPSTTSVNDVTYRTSKRYFIKQAILGIPGLTGLGEIGDTITGDIGGASTTLYVKTGASTWTAK